MSSKEAPVQVLVALGSKQLLVEHNLEHSGVVAFGHTLHQIQLRRVDDLKVRSRNSQRIQHLDLAAAANTNNVQDEMKLPGQLYLRM